MSGFIISPFYPISDRVDESHRAGWARYWAQEHGCDLITTSSMSLVDKLKRGDVLLCYHGMEFKGQLNLQSGLTEDILLRVKRLLQAHKRGVKIQSIDQPMPDYGKLLMERGMDPTSGEVLSKICRSTRFLPAPRPDPETIVIGDSHALSMYVPGSIILRHDALTLHGALSRGGSWGGLLTDLNILEHEWQTKYRMLPKLTYYFGNIDVRHHLARFPDTKTKVRELVKEYLAQLAIVVKEAKPYEIEVVLPLPIEDESRPIPKSGWYKGEPFFGSWERRHQIRLMLRDELKRQAKKYGYSVYDHPRHFIQKDGKLSFDVMEKPRSVHIRPAEYRLIQEGHEWQT